MAGCDQPSRLCRSAGPALDRAGRPCPKRSNVPCPKPSSSPPPARPIGRADKGSLVDMRPDDLAALIVDAVLDKVPAARPQPRRGRDLGLRPARRARRATTSAAVAAILAGMPDVPGVTVNRYCSSSLQTIRMAAHAIKAGEGDVFIAAGVETVSRYHARRGRHRPAQPEVRRRRGPHRRAHRGRRPSRGRPPRACPTSTSPWARPPRTCAEFENVSREEMDEFAALVAAAGQRVARERLLRAGDHAGHHARRHGRHARTTASGAGTTVEKLAELKPVFRPDGKVTAGNACPLNDGAAAVIVMSDTKAAELGLTPLARIVASGVTGLNPEIMGLGPIEAMPPGARSAPA